MEPSVVIFFILLLIPGFWLILSVGSLIKRREMLDEQYRIEQEHTKSLTQRRHISRRPVQHHEEAHEEEIVVASPALTTAGEASEAHSPDIFTTSQVNEAFEKFLLNVPAAASSSARAARSSSNYPPTKKIITVDSWPEKL